MALTQIKPELLQKWQRKGELLTIWRCERCYKMEPLYKTTNSLINAIYLSWARNHKYCPLCEAKMKGLSKKKPVKIIRINTLLEKYEPYNV